MRNTSLILVLHNNGFTGIDQPNKRSRRLKMTKQKQMTEKELDQVNGGVVLLVVEDPRKSSPARKGELVDASQTRALPMGLQTRALIDF
jgi:bacteriocin-like protein